MKLKNLKIFDLDYSGMFKEVRTDNQLDLFTLYNILAIYDPLKKIMYIWKGKHVANSLKLYIPNIRDIFTKSYPDLKVLRNITLEYGSENQEFLKIFNFTKEELTSHIGKQEQKVQPYLLKIAELKSEIDELIETRDYKDAIAYSDEVTILARKIEDKGLIRDQENLQTRLNDLLRKKRIDTISEIDDLRIIEMNYYRLGKIYETIEKARKIIKLAKTVKLEDIIKEQEDFIARLIGKFNIKFSISEIRAASEEARNQFNQLIESNEIIEAHSLVRNFKEKFGDDFDLTGISSAAYFISKDEELWKKYIEVSEKKKKKLNQIEKKLLKSIESGSLKTAQKQMEQAQELLDDLKDPELDSKWINIKKEFTDEEELARKDIEKSREEIKNLLTECGVLSNESKYDQAIGKLDSALQKLELYDLPDLTKKVDSKREEILAKKDEIKAFIQKVEDIIKECQTLSEDRKYEEAIARLDSCLKEIEPFNIPNSTSKVIEFKNELLRKRGELNKFVKDTEDAFIECQKLVDDGQFQKAIKRISDRFKDLEPYHLTELEEKLNRKSREIIERSIEKSKALTEHFQFEEALGILNSCLKELESKNMYDLKSEVEALKNEILNKKQENDEIRENIRILESDFQKSRDNKDLKRVLSLEKQVIDISHVLKEKNMENEFNDVVNRIQNEINQIKANQEEQKIKLEKLYKFKEKVRDLNKEGLIYVEKQEFSISLEKYNKILELFSEYIKDK